MSCEKHGEGISYDNIRINSMVSSSGVFAGCNIQCLWGSDRRTQSGFGRIIGEDNFMESPCSVTTDSESSSELLKYFEEHIGNSIRKRGI
jgi:hypothetical protein